mmetsp:Transcript_36985/g.114213  ORF Transcript_36985/g.114213 Transcript_36985/m.114213 type:complete len:237 (-) Transcript_36985:647-1357(-)
MPAGMVPTRTTVTLLLACAALTLPFSAMAQQPLAPPPPPSTPTNETTTHVALDSPGQPWPAAPPANAPQDNANGFSGVYVVITAVGASLFIIALVAGIVVFARRPSTPPVSPRVNRHASYISQHSVHSLDTVPASVQVDSRGVRPIKPPQMSDDDDGCCGDEPKPAWSTGGVVIANTPTNDEIAIAKARSLSIASVNSHPATSANSPQPLMANTPTAAGNSSDGASDPRRPIDDDI